MSTLEGDPKDKKNHAFCLETIEFNNRIEGDILALAERYYRISQMRLFLPYWETFEDYCDELKNMSYASVMKLIDIHATFVVSYKFSPARIAKAGGWTKIAEVLPVIKNKKDAEVWLDKAETLSRAHLRAEVNEKKTGIPQITCKHKDFYLLKHCRACRDTESIPLGPEIIIAGIKYKRV